jgi:hypothetical protein
MSSKTKWRMLVQAGILEWQDGALIPTESWARSLRGAVKRVMKTDERDLRVAVALALTERAPGISDEDALEALRFLIQFEPRSGVPEQSATGPSTQLAAASRAKRPRRR